MDVSHVQLDRFPVQQIVDVDGSWLDGDTTVDELFVAGQHADIDRTGPRVVDQFADLAAGEFARAYHRYARQVDRPAILRKIADAYELAGRNEHAYRWCTKAAREHPSVRFDHQGRLVTFLEYRERLAHVRDRVEPSRPHMVLPLRGRFTRDLEENVSLLTPWFGDEPTSRWSRCFVRTPAGIRALDPRSGEWLWPEAAPTRANVQLLIARSDVAVFATSYDVFALDAVTGEQRWSHGDDPPNLDDEPGDWEDTEAFRSHALEGDRLLSVRDSGRMACVAVDTGERLWSQTHRPEPIGRVRLTETWVVYHVLQDDRTVVCLLDAGTGAWSGAIMTDERRAVEGLFVTLDGRIILATSQSISSFDPETHARHWRVAADGHIRRTSLLEDVDALYFSDDGHRLKKISLENGALLWESERLVPRSDDDLTVGLQDGSVIVSSAASVSGVDAVTGLTLWRGTTPERPRFATRLITRSYVIAVDVPGGFLDIPSVAYLYDHRNASGVIPREGGAPQLGALTDVRATLAADGALLIQAGSTIMGWASE